MLAADVLQLAGKAFGGHDAFGAHPGNPTPDATEDHTSKRQRTMPISCDQPAGACGSSSSGQHSHPPVGGAQPCRAGATVRVSSPPVAAAAVLPWHASYLLDYVQRCLEGLARMYETCAFIQTDTKAAQMACAIFRQVYLRQSASEQAAMLANNMLSQALLAASLWVAVKFEATRSSTPDSRIMSRVTGIPARMLVQQEKLILNRLGWHLMAAAREAGAVGLPDYTDAVCIDQQRQLAAALAAPALAPAAVLPAAILPAAAPQQGLHDLLLQQHLIALQQAAAPAAMPANLLAVLGLSG